jgi:hypothetical protein
VPGRLKGAVEDHNRKGTFLYLGKTREQSPDWQENPEPVPVFPEERFIINAHYLPAPMFRMSKGPLMTPTTE